MKTQNTVKEALDRVFMDFDSIIEAAPDDMEQEVAELKEPEPTRPDHRLIGFPERHSRSVVLQGEEWQVAHDKALGIVEAGGIVIAYGERGTGKTQIAYEIAKKAIFADTHYPREFKDGFHWQAKVRPCVYVKAMDIFMRLKNGFTRKDQPSELEIIEGLADAAFLIIDEAHVRGETKYEDDKLTHLLDKRYDAMRPTMLITNLSRKDFAAQLSPSIISRIEEIGGGIECNWQSYRKQTK
jgi:DNA replication protein DnaC